MRESIFTFGQLGWSVAGIPLAYILFAEHLLMYIVISFVAMFAFVLFLFLFLFFWVASDGACHFQHFEGTHTH